MQNLCSAYILTLLGHLLPDGGQFMLACNCLLFHVTDSLTTFFRDKSLTSGIIRFLTALILISLYFSTFGLGKKTLASEVY